MNESSVAVDLGPVRKEVTVAAPVDVAFRVFTTEMGSWWPLERFGIRKTDIRELVFESRRGGRIYERWDDGEGDWGRVLAWEPPSRVLLAWQPGGDLSDPTELEIRFEPRGPKRTVVHLEHRGWERLRREAAESRAGYDSGWVTVLARYVDHFESR